MSNEAPSAWTLFDTLTTFSQPIKNKFVDTQNLGKLGRGLIQSRLLLRTKFAFVINTILLRNKRCIDDLARCSIATISRH